MLKKRRLKKIKNFIQSTSIKKQIKEQVELKNSAISSENNRQEERLKTRQEKLLIRYENGELTNDRLYEALRNLNKRKQNIKTNPLIPENIVELLDIKLEVDINPTVSHYLLYQEIINEIHVNENKEITRIYLSNLPYDILELGV